MAKRRRPTTHETEGGDDRRVWASKRLTVNLGDYQSYHFEYGFEDAVLPGETRIDAARRLKADIEELLNEDIAEIEVTKARIPSRNRTRR